MERNALMEVRGRWTKEKEKWKDAICKVKILEGHFLLSGFPSHLLLKGVFVSLAPLCSSKSIAG